MKKEAKVTSKGQITVPIEIRRLIGDYALCRGYQLLTFDDRLYRAAFPELTWIRI